MSVQRGVTVGGDKIFDLEAKKLDKFSGTIWYM